MAYASFWQNYEQGPSDPIGLILTGLPAECSPDHMAVQRISPVVSRTVGDERDEAGVDLPGNAGLLKACNGMKHHGIIAHG
jgi:hypothetical protein